MCRSLTMALLLSVAVVAISATGTPAAGSVYNFVNSRAGKSYTGNYAEIIRCVGRMDAACLLDKAEDYLVESRHNLLVEADEAVQATGRKQDSESPSALMESITSMITGITDMIFKNGLTGLFRDAKDEDGDESSEVEAVENDDEDDEDEDAETAVETKKNSSAKGRSINDVIQEQNSKEGVTKCQLKLVLEKVEGRGKKKKKKKAKKALIKLLLLGGLVATKISLLLKVLAAHLQVKFLIIAALGLLINAARFYIDLKKGHSPQKVIYYEHAQHQHHYENDEGYDSGHGHGGGGGGGYWGRSYEEEQANKKQAAQEMAYSEQKPSGLAYTKVDDTPNFSFF